MKLLLLTIQITILITAAASLSAQQKPAGADTSGKKVIPAEADKQVKAPDKGKTDPIEKQMSGEKKDSPADKDKPEDKKTADENAKEAADKKKDADRAESLENVLKYGLQSERREAVRRVVTIKDKALREKLSVVLLDIVKNDREPEVIARSINTLGDLGYTAASDAIVVHIDNASEDVQIAAVYTLKKLNSTSSTAAMAAKLKKQDLTTDSNFTEALILTLGDFKSEEIYQTAEEAINSPKTTKNLKEQFVIYMGKLGTTKPKDMLLKIYKDPDEDLTLRAYAVNSIAKLGIKEAIPDIQAVLKEIDSYNYKKKKKYNSLQIYSTGALAKLGDASVVPILISQLKSDNSGVRLKAVNLLKELGDKSSIDILKYRMKNDPDKKVRKAAKGALKALGVDVDDEPGTDDPEEEQKDDAPEEQIKKDKK